MLRQAILSIRSELSDWYNKIERFVLQVRHPNSFDIKATLTVNIRTRIEPEINKSCFLLLSLHLDGSATHLLVAAVEYPCGQRSGKILVEDHVLRQEVVGPEAVARNGGFSQFNALALQTFRQFDFHVERLLNALRSAFDELACRLPGHITGLVDLFLDGGRVAGEE